MADRVTPFYSESAAANAKDQASRAEFATRLMWEAGYNMLGQRLYRAERLLRPRKGKKGSAAWLLVREAKQIVRAARIVRKNDEDLYRRSENFRRLRPEEE